MRIFNFLSTYVKGFQPMGVYITSIMTSVGGDFVITCGFTPSAAAFLCGSTDSSYNSWSIGWDNMLAHMCLHYTGYNNLSAFSNQVCLSVYKDNTDGMYGQVTKILTNGLNLNLALVGAIQIGIDIIVFP